MQTPRTVALMRPLRIGIVAPMVVKSATGLSNYISELVPQLCDSGQEVTVIAADCAYRGGPADELVYIDSRATVRLFPSRGRVSRRVYHSAQLASWLRANIKDFDVIDIQGLWFWTTVDAARICLESGVPYVLTLHGMMGRWDWAKKPWAKQLFFHAVLKRYWRRASAVRYLSHGELESSKIIPESRVAIIPAAISMPQAPTIEEITRIRRKLNALGDEPMVLFVGRVNAQKGVLELVRAFEFVRQRCPIALLVIAGALEGEYGESVKAAASVVNEQFDRPAIHVLGRVSREDKAALLASASVFVTLSRNEGMSSAILEALGQGVPVVCTKNSNVPEVAEFGAGVITTLDPSDASGAISGLLVDAPRRRAMADNARKLVEDRFTWKSIVPQLLELYSELARPNACQTEYPEKLGALQP